MNRNKNPLRDILVLHTYIQLHIVWDLCISRLWDIKKKKWYKNYVHCARDANVMMMIAQYVCVWSVYISIWKSNGWWWTCAEWGRFNYYSRNEYRSSTVVCVCVYYIEKACECHRSIYARMYCIYTWQSLVQVYWDLRCGSGFHM